MKKYENFCNAFRNLKDIYDYQEPFSNVELAGMITDEQEWMNALQSRNNVSHSYNQSIALDIIKNCKDIYYGLFEKLKAEVDHNWL